MMASTIYERENQLRRQLRKWIYVMYSGLKHFRYYQWLWTNSKFRQRHVNLLKLRH